MKHIIIGTAGHVDHGKTTLIRALTGSDTDRLKEEQERGMTIDLGFAALTLADGTSAGIVDVPGHERFLKNMLAGAGGIDVVLLVIAADESVMPQTEEHLDILRLLDVKYGVVALTKVDRVDREWLAVVEEDIRDRLASTFLQDAPLVRVDSIKGKGINELKRALLSVSSKTHARNASSPMRLPVDRVFTRAGFGTVVTGTLVAGTLRAGDLVELQPQGLASRVRGLQVHGKKTESAEAGSRVAVNLAGIEVEQIERGAVITPPGMLRPTQMFDAKLRLLESASKPLKNRARVRLYLGTAEILGRVQLLGVESLEPGKEAYVQFRAEHPFASARGDRFVVRTYSPMHTVGGGIVLDTSPPRHRRFDPEVVSRLTAKERGTPEDLITSWLQTLPYGAPGKEMGKALGLSEDEVGVALEALAVARRVVALENGRWVDASALLSLQDRLIQTLQAYHSAHPLRPGMHRDELRSSLSKQMDGGAYRALMSYLVQQGVVVAEGSVIRLTGFRIVLSERQQAILDQITAVFKSAGYATPTIEEAATASRLPLDTVGALVRVALDSGTLVKVDESLLFHAETLQNARQMIRRVVQESGSITVSQFRDMTGSSRKYAMPLLEYFDSIHFTRREGDARVLIGGSHHAPS